MIPSKVSCPNCGTVLNVPVPLTAGAAFQCPRCRSGFRVQLPVAAAAWNGAEADQQRARASELVCAQPERAGVLPEITSVAPMGRSLERPQQVNRGLRIGLVLGGFFLILALGGVLLAVCLSGDPGADRGSRELAEQQEDVGAPQVKPLVVQRPLIELSAADNATVANMVERGVAFLKKTQGADAWGRSGQADNYVAFGGLTLLECGVPAGDPAIQKAAQFARQRCPHINRTYPAALFLLFFDRLNDPQDKERIHDLAMRLVAGQTAHGGWSYNLPPLSAEDAASLAAFLRGLGRDSLGNMRRAQPERTKSLPRSLDNFGPLGTPATPGGDYFRQGGDNSNTQFALLALWAARRHQAPVEQALDLVVRRFRNSQNPDGSFSYAGHGMASPVPSMTCAGLLGLAVGHGLADKSAGAGPREDAAIQNALAHLSSAIGQPAPDARANIPMTEMYFLWSIERVAVLYQLKKIIDKDWYQWGYTMLRKNQRTDGSWAAHRGHGSDAFTDTCFALLFLQRVNLVKDLTDKLEEMNAARVAANGEASHKE